MAGNARRPPQQSRALVSLERRLRLPFAAVAREPQLTTDPQKREGSRGALAASEHEKFDASAREFPAERDKFPDRVTVNEGQTGEVERTGRNPLSHRCSQKLEQSRDTGKVQVTPDPHRQSLTATLRVKDQSMACIHARSLLCEPRSEAAPASVLHVPATESPAAKAIIPPVHPQVNPFPCQKARDFLL